MEQLLALEMVRVTEAAALASARFMGRGEKDEADRAAVEAMRRTMDEIEFAGRIVIGEGERDEAPMLWIGEPVGQRTPPGVEDNPEIDIAVDPLEGTNLVAHGQAGAITVLAASEKGGLVHAPDTYLDKLCVGPVAAGRVDIRLPPRENLARIATELRRSIGDITVVILERPRHDALIAEVRDTGARIKLIGDGDLSAAIASARHMGRGEKDAADAAATEAMRRTMDEIDFRGRIVIGEGERDEAPMLYIGERVGRDLSDTEVPRIDIAVDPLEGTNLVAHGQAGAITVLAASETGGLTHAPDTYMEKICVGPLAAGHVDIQATPTDNLRSIAEALGRRVSDITVVILERPRHDALIAEVRDTGARIKLIGDGDLSAAIACAVSGTGVHVVMGIGGAPEGVITAAALRCLGGEIQARFRYRSDEERERGARMGHGDEERVYRTEDLAPGENLVFAATGVTAGDLLEGVRFFGGGARTHSLVMAYQAKQVRFVDTVHMFDRDSPPRVRL